MTLAPASTSAQASAAPSHGEGGDAARAQAVVPPARAAPRRSRDPSQASADPNSSGRDAIDDTERATQPQGGAGQRESQPASAGAEQRESQPASAARQPEAEQAGRDAAQAGAVAAHPDADASPSAERPANGYWSEGKPRWFVSSRSELGLPYAKPYFSAGFGMPHWIWAGVDLNAILTMEVIEVFSGLRLSSPVFDVSLGVRDNWSLVKPFLKPRESYNRSEVLGASGPRAHYWAAELDALAIVPLPYSAIGVNFVWVDTWDVPDNHNLYEESYRLITKSRSFFVMRFAALARVLNEGSLRVGALAEHAWGTGRGKGVWRVGPVMSVQLTDHLQFNLAVTLKVASPDALGLALGAFGTAGLRYQWATGERRPELPWRGDLIPFSAD